MACSLKYDAIRCRPLALAALLAALFALATAASDRRLLAKGGFVCTRYGGPYRQPYGHEKLNDASQTCAGGTANNACTSPNGCKDYCPACGLYVGISWTAPQSQMFTQTSERGGHRMVLPVQPCRGVEDWKVRWNACGGEKIWDYAWKYAGSAGPTTAYALGANSPTQRTQHQLHVHVAKMQASLAKVLSNVDRFQDRDWVSIVCTNKIADDCKWNKDPTASPIQAKYVDGSSISDANPFEVVYGNGNNEMTDVILVTQQTTRGIVVLRANDRPVECFLDCDNDCQTHCG